MFLYLFFLKSAHNPHPCYIRNDSGRPHLRSSSRSFRNPISHLNNMTIFHKSLTHFQCFTACVTIGTLHVVDQPLPKFHTGP